MIIRHSYSAVSRQPHSAAPLIRCPAVNLSPSFGYLRRVAAAAAIVRRGRGWCREICEVELSKRCKLKTADSETSPLSPFLRKCILDAAIPPARHTYPLLGGHGQGFRGRLPPLLRKRSPCSPSPIVTIFGGDGCVTSRKLADCAKLCSTLSSSPYLGVSGNF